MNISYPVFGPTKRNLNVTVSFFTRVLRSPKIHQAVRIIICTLALIAAVSSNVFGDDLTVTSFSVFEGQTNILLQATGDITFSGGSMNLPALPPGASSGRLSIQAGNDIIIQNGTSISAGPGWSLSFLAGNSLTGTGFITAAGNVTIQTGGMFPTNWSGTTDLGGTITIGGDGQGGIGIFESGPAVPVGPPAQLILLDSQVNGANITAVVGTNVLFFFIPDDNAQFIDITSCRFQWFKNGRKLHGETNDVLSLTNIRLIDAGNYSVVASNTGGRIKSNVRLLVLPPLHDAGHRRFC